MLTPTPELGKPTGSLGLPSPKVRLKPLAHLVKQGGLPHRAGNPASFYSERADPPAAASGAHYGGLSPCVSTTTSIQIPPTTHADIHANHHGLLCPRKNPSENPTMLHVPVWHAEPEHKMVDMMADLRSSSAATPPA